jgi:hypothetical protein
MKASPVEVRMPLINPAQQERKRKNKGCKERREEYENLQIEK